MTASVSDASHSQLKKGMFCLLVFELSQHGCCALTGALFVCTWVQVHDTLHKLLKFLKICTLLCRIPEQFLMQLLLNGSSDMVEAEALHCIFKYFSADQKHSKGYYDMCDACIDMDGNPVVSHSQRPCAIAPVPAVWKCCSKRTSLPLALHQCHLLALC